MKFKPNYIHFKIFDVIIVFILMSFSWIFFRARDITDAYYIITHMHKVNNFFTEIDFIDLKYLIISLSLILFLIFINIIINKQRLDVVFAKRKTWQRWALYYMFILSFYFLGNFNNSKFIYFQF